MRLIPPSIVTTHRFSVALRASTAVKTKPEKSARSLTLFQERYHSSNTSKRLERKQDKTVANSTDDDTSYKHPTQSFVKTRFTPGEYDPETRSNPLYRPPWKNRARIMSAEDFANRPKVSFEQEFDSIHDAMVVLSWLSEDERQSMYSMYLRQMTDMASGNEGPTSHEYVMNVIAQKYNITPTRVAAIVQNCHDEEQAKKRGEKIYTKAQEYVDAKIREHIVNCYNCYRETDPQTFVEDPVGVTPGIKDPENRVRDVVRVEDLYDVDELMEKAEERSKEDTQLYLDNRAYIEDEDDSLKDMKVNAECLKLIQAKNDSFKALNTIMKRNENDRKDYPLPNGVEGIEGNDNDVLKENQNEAIGQEQRRPRWKYAAKLINTREEKKMKQKVQREGSGGRSKKSLRKIVLDDKQRNILVEHDGMLRVGTANEVGDMSWKPERNTIEFIYQGVKKAWMRRQLRGEVGGWGKVTLKERKKLDIKKS